MQSFVMALRSIGANKMRAILTMLGIIIGVMALVVLVSLVSGATDSVTTAVSDMGTSLVTVTISDDKGKPVRLSDLDEWTKEPDIGLISARSSSTVVGKHDANYDSVTVYGTTPSYYQIQGLQLSLGRWLKASDQKNAAYVCVLNEAAADELIGYTDCVGQTITLNGVRFTVVGVLEENEDSLTSVLTSGMLMAYIPYSSLIRLTDSVSNDVTTFYLSAAEGSTVDAAADAMENILMERFDEDEDAFDVDASNMLEEAMNKVTSTLSLLLGGIAGISLVVGGIGIMNIMMVTVTERTREIGIRKAIGASRGNILTQFLMEAVVLCMIGCGLGIFLSWAILQVVSTVTVSAGITFSLNMGVVGLAVAFCFLIGVVFGLYPANKAAKRTPIDARHYGGYAHPEKANPPTVQPLAPPAPSCAVAGAHAPDGPAAAGRGRPPGQYPQRQCKFGLHPHRYPRRRYAGSRGPRGYLCPQRCENYGIPCEKWGFCQQRRPPCRRGQGQRHDRHYRNSGFHVHSEKTDGNLFQREGGDGGLCHRRGPGEAGLRQGGRPGGVRHAGAWGFGGAEPGQ